MTSRFLQIFGVVALAGLVVGSLAALGLVKSRLSITIAEERELASRGPDPIELLRADLAELRGELSAVGASVPDQLQVLHEALSTAEGEHAQAQRAELAELRRQVAALQARVDASAAELGAIRVQSQDTLTRLASAINELSAAVAAGAAQAAELQSRAAELAKVEVTPVEVAPIEVVAVAPVEVTTPEPATPEAPKKGFLTFKVPAQGFRFEGRQRLSVVSSLSRVGFDAKSTLHDFSGVTQKVEGELTVDLAQPALKPSGRLEVDATSLDTGLADRDEGMRELLEAKTQPKLVFEWTAFEARSVDAATQSVTGTARGKLSIRGASREVAMPVTVTVDASKRVGIEGELVVKLTDFGIKPPSQLGMISVEDEIKLWISLRARTLGPAEEAK